MSKIKKKVFQYSNNGDFIEEFNSQIEAAEKVLGERSKRYNISKAVKEKRLSGGFYWSDIKKGNFFEEDRLNLIRNTLIIGDLHAPFTRDNYIDFCQKIYNKYKCNEVIFIGDIVDNHFSSFHETDTDGHSAAQELKLAKEQIKDWYELFPKAKVCLGNHDLIPSRKLFSAGVSQSWIRPISEVLETPGWEYDEKFVIDNVMYVHGVGRKARNRMYKDLMNIIQGHYHSESYIEYSVGLHYKLFAMQIGCGVEDKSYAMAYGKHFDKMHINCGVVLNNGTLPILEYMKL